MAANAADKFTKARQNWSGQLDGSGIADESVDSFGLVSAANLPTDTAVYLSIDRIDANGDETNGKWEVVKGVVSDNNVTSVTRGVEGTAQAHSAGAVVEYLMTASQWNDLYEGLTAEHSQLDGTHTSATVATLKATSAEITTGTEDGKVVTPKGLKDAGVVATAKSTGAEIAVGTEDAKFNTPKALADAGYLTGWIPAGETWTYASATRITVPSDARIKHQKGDKIRLKQGGDYKYFYVVGVAATVLTVTGGSDYTVANAPITDNYYSKVESPQGFPDWFDWTPEYSASGSMTFTSVNTECARFKISGQACSICLRATGTTGGTASNALRATLPISMNGPEINTGAAVRDTAIGAGWAGILTNGSDVFASKMDNSNFGLGGTRRMAVCITYPI